jgi:hypothetical protein
VTELPLFAEPARVRSSDPDTSQEAAASLSEATIKQSCQQIYNLIVHYGGLTTFQIVEATGLDRGNTARRITDLRQAGWIRDSGDRLTGPTGRRSIVWIPVEAHP